MADDLDAILDSALDELDDDHDEGEEAKACPTIGEGVASAGAAEAGSTARCDGCGKTGGREGAATSVAAKSCGVVAGGPIHTAKEAVDGAGRGNGGPEGELSEEEERELQQTIAKTIEMLGQQGGSAGPDGDAMFEDGFLNELASEFEKLGQQVGQDSDGGDAMVDNMVQQLLAKDLMYPPVKQVTEEYPAWLRKHKGEVEPAVYKRYEEHYRLFMEIVDAYENDEKNMPRLLDLMTKAQEFGQPPAEIVQALMPGVAPGPIPMPGGASDGDPCSVM